MSDVFISYSRKEIAFARLLRESLQQNDIDTWIDWERIPVGERWWDEICQAIENANVFMFIISKNSIGSPVCKDEINHALKNHKRIIPIIVDELTPETVREFVPELPQINWIIFEKDHLFRIEENPEAQAEKPEDNQVALPKQPQFVEALEKLSQAIHTDWEWVKYHTRLQVNALLWESNRRDPGYLIHGTALEEAEQQLLRASEKSPKPTDLQVEYVTASRKEETQRQEEKLALEKKARARQRLVIWAVGIGLGVAIVLGCAAIVLGGVAWNQRNQAVSAGNSRATAEANAIGEANSRATAEANAIQQRDIAVVRQLAAQARNLAAGHFDEGLLLAVEGQRQMDLSEARSSLLYMVSGQPQLERYLPQRGWGWGQAVYSPDGKLLAIGTVDHSILLLDSGSGEAVAGPLTGLNAEVLSLAFSPDGQTLFAGDDAGYVLSWDISDPKLLLQKDSFPIGLNNEPQMITMASGLRPLMVGYFGPSRYLWNVTAGQQVNISEQGITALSFSPDGRTLAAGFGSGAMVLLDPSSGIVTKGLAALKQAGYNGDALMVLDLGFTPDGQNLIASTAYGQIRVWNPETDKAYSLPHMQLAPVLSRAAISPDGKTLAYTLDNDSAVFLWEMEKQEFQRYPLENGEKITSMAYEPDGKRLALGLVSNAIEFWDPETHQVVGSVLHGHHGEVMSLAFSPDGKKLASMDWEHTVITWELQAGNRLLTTIDQPSTEPFGLDVSSDGRYLAAWEEHDYEKYLRVLDLSSTPPASQTFTQTDLGLSPVEFYLAFLPHTHVAAFYGFSNDLSTSEIVFWDVEAKKIILTVPQASAPLAVSPDGKWLAAIKTASGAGDSKVAIWDARTGSLVHELVPGDRSASGASTLAFSPDSRLLAAGGANADVWLWRVDTGQPEAGPLIGHLDQVTGVAFSPDGSTLASSSADKTIRLWNVAQPDQPSVELAGNTAWITGIAYSPDGHMLASTSTDGSIRLWDAESRSSLGQLGSSRYDQLYNPVFAADGSGFFAAGIKRGASSEDNQGIIVHWLLDPVRWSETACSLARRNLSLTEWQNDFGEMDYRKTCAGQPLHPSIMEEFFQMELEKLRTGGLQAALDDFVKTLPFDPALKAELEADLKTFPVGDLADAVAADTEGGMISPAVGMYQAFKGLGREKDISAQTWNTVCWYGSLWKHADQVLDICQLAVSLDPSNGGIRDSRGLALVLTGRTLEAIPDFQAFIDWSAGNPNLSSEAARRQEWIAALQKGQNPFTDQVLQSLLNP